MTQSMLEKAAAAGAGEQQALFITRQLREPRLFAFFGDQHLSFNGESDIEAAVRHAKLIAETKGAFAVLCGDVLDNQIKHLGTIINTPSTPSLELSLFCEYLDLFGGKIIGMVAGNHDLWTYSRAGVEPQRIIASIRRIPYFRHEMRIVLTNRSRRPVCEIAVRHKIGRFNSAMNPCHSLKQWLRFGDRPWDIGVCGHTHSPALEMFVFHGRPRYAAVVGAYQRSSDYAQAGAYPRAEPFSPAFIITPSGSVVPYWRVEDAVEYFRSKYGG